MGLVCGKGLKSFHALLLNLLVFTNPEALQIPLLGFWWKLPYTGMIDQSISHWQLNSVFSPTALSKSLGWGSNPLATSPHPSGFSKNYLINRNSGVVERGLLGITTHVYCSYHLVNSKSFQRSVPVRGMKITCWFLSISHRITALMLSLLPMPPRRSALSPWCWAIRTRVADLLHSLNSSGPLHHLMLPCFLHFCLLSSTTELPSVSGS